jgi:hypothetical protein
MRIALIHGNDGSDVRVGKTCRSLARLGFDVHFIGWDRRPGAKKIDLGGATAHVTRHATRTVAATSRPGYGSSGTWCVRCIACARTSSARSTRNWRSRAAVQGPLLRSPRLRRLRLARRARQASSVVQALAAAGIANALGSRLGSPDRHRRDPQGHAGPVAGRRSWSRTCPRIPGRNSAVAPQGPVGSGRPAASGGAQGLRQLLEAIEPLEGVQVVSAGWPYDAFASAGLRPAPARRVPRHRYGARALELAASCDAVFCYYAPDQRVHGQRQPQQGVRRDGRRAPGADQSRGAARGVGGAVGRCRLHVCAYYGTSRACGR